MLAEVALLSYSFPMPTKLPLLLLAALLGNASSTRAQEHPREHPSPAQPQTPAPSQPAEATTAQPAEGEGEQGQAGEEHEEISSPAELREEMAATVEGFIELESHKTGYFPLKDDKTKREWRLKPAQVSESKVVLLGEGRAFACAEMKTVDGRHVLDVDFYLKQSEEGGWEKEKLLVHRVDGKPRYFYDKDHNIVYTKPPVPRKASKKRAAKRR